MTADTCVNSCASLGYPTAAIKDVKYCYCSTEDNIDATHLLNTLVANSFCETQCPGDSNVFCGAMNYTMTFTLNHIIQVIHFLDTFLYFNLN
jgi:hypothetical protein